MKHICENCLTIIYKSKVTPTECPHCESGKMFDIGDSIADHILNLESKLSRLQQASRWIPVEDYLNNVEVKTKEGKTYKAFYFNGNFWEVSDPPFQGYIKDVTHVLLYLPTPPEGE